MMNSAVTVGVKQERKRIQLPSSLSPAPLSLWLRDKGKAPTEVGALKIRGVPTVELVQGNHGGLGCCPIWQPRENSLPQPAPLCKPVCVQGHHIANKLGLVRGTPLPEKQRAARFKTRYATEARDEYGEKDNPGNEQLFDAATGAASRSLHDPQGLINLSRSIPDLWFPECAVAPYCKCKGTRLLCLKTGEAA